MALLYKFIVLWELSRGTKVTVLHVGSSAPFKIPRCNDKMANEINIEL